MGSMVPARSARGGTTPGRVTAAMVAREAGVSPSTVSLVVAGKAEGRISAANRAKVEAAVERLGYVVDTAGSSLSKGYSPIVVLVATDIANPFYSELITAARSALGDRYELLLSVSDVGSQAGPPSLRRLLSLRPAGFLIDAPTPALVASIPDGTNVVLLDAPDIASSWPTVNLDVTSGAAALARHLAALGHRRVAYLDSVIDVATFHERREAFAYTAAEAGVTVEPVARSLTSVDHARRTFADAWPGWQASGVTAVVGCTDTHAYGVLEHAAALGLAVPGDLAVAGFDDLPQSRQTNPPLTSVRLPARDLGAAAARTLRTLIEGGEEAAPAALLDSELLVRESTASG